MVADRNRLPNPKRMRKKNAARLSPTVGSLVLSEPSGLWPSASFARETDHFFLGALQRHDTVNSNSNHRSQVTLLSRTFVVAFNPISLCGVRASVIPWVMIIGLLHISLSLCIPLASFVN